MCSLEVCKGSRDSINVPRECQHNMGTDLRTVAGYDMPAVRRLPELQVILILNILISSFI